LDKKTTSGGLIKITAQSCQFKFYLIQNVSKYFLKQTSEAVDTFAKAKQIAQQIDSETTTHFIAEIEPLLTNHRKSS
jgi:hypothetical protein